MNLIELRSYIRRVCSLRFCAAIPLLLLLTLSVRAQVATASITGAVSNQETKAFLEGARVSLVELNRNVLTGRDGGFTFTNVPPGDYTVKTYYTGLDEATSKVALSAGQAASLDVPLSSGVYQLEKFSVSASIEGEAASLTKQRNADNVVNVVSMDAFGNVADGNIGNFMVRLPGVSGEFENGEVVGIRIRGTPVEFSSLSVDGVRAAGAFSGFNTQGDRGAQSDQIPAEFIKEVEVVKAPTPDMSADSIGGSTNLITKSALDFNSDLFTYRLGANYNLHRDDLQNFTPNAAVSWMTRLGAKRNIGMALSLSYTDTEAPRDRVQMQRIEADGRNTQARTLTNANRRVRGGAGLKFDYRLDDQTSVYFKFQYNYYHFDSDRLVYSAAVTGNRLVADYNVVSRAQIVAGTIPRTTANVAAGVAPGYTDTSTEMLNSTWTFDGDNNVKTGRQYLFEVGGEKKFSGDQQINAQLTYNPSTFESDLRTFLMTLGTGIGMSIDTSADRSRPLFRQTYGPSIGYGVTDFNRYTARFSGEPETGDEDMANARIDYSKLFSGWIHPVEFKTGAAWRSQDRNNTSRRPIWNYVGADGVAGLNTVTGINDDNLGQYMLAAPAYTVFDSSGVWPQLPGVDYEKARKAFLDQPNLFRAQGTTVSASPSFTDISEQVSAAYIQGKVVAGKFTVLTGVRFEKTEVEATGGFSDPRNTTVTRVTRTSSYDDFFPSIHFRYDLRSNLVARASVSTGAARPNMSDLYPTTVIGYDDSTGLGTVTQNDPGLKAQYSRNYDLSLEYYFEPAGLVSAGWFRKDITDFLARSSGIIDSGLDNGFNGSYAGFILNSTTNLGEAEVEGFEFNYSQQLTMLPAPFNGIRLFGNYTDLKTSGTYSNGVTELVKFIPKTGNAGFSMLWRNFEFRASYRYTGAYLSSYNVNVNQQQRTLAVGTYDLNFQYKFNPKFAVFLDVINVTNEWPEFYTGRDSGRIVISDIYGTRLNMGITGRF